MGRAGLQRGGTASPRAVTPARVLRGRAAAASPAAGVHSSAVPLGAPVGMETGSQGCETSQGENFRAQGVGEHAFCKSAPLPTSHGHAPASAAGKDRKGSDLRSCCSAGIFRSPVFNFIWR